MKAPFKRPTDAFKKGNNLLIIRLKTKYKCIQIKIISFKINSNKIHIKYTYIKNNLKVFYLFEAQYLI